MRGGSTATKEGRRRRVDLLEKLALLLYYYFEEALRSLSSYRVVGGRTPLDLAAIEGGDSLLWATAAIAVISNIISPGYLPDYKVVTSSDIVGLIPDTLHAHLHRGEADNVIPWRDLCSPENIAAYIVAVHALRVVEREGLSKSTLARRVSGIIRATWLSSIEDACLSTRYAGLSSDIRHEEVLVEAIRRIERGVAPDRFKLLLPIIKSMIKPSLGAGPGKTGAMYLDVYAELRALASLLDRYDIPVSRKSFRERVFRGGEVKICYQAGIINPQGGCNLTPDIVIVDYGEKIVTLIEVKSVAVDKDYRQLAARVRDRIKEARRQLVEYIYSLAVLKRMVCGISIANTKWRINGIIAYYTPGNVGISPDDEEAACSREYGFRIIHVDELRELW
jgi:hypothetical protein